MASLHVKHSRGCALGNSWSRPDSEGCTCDSTYYVVVRDGRKTEKIRVGRNRKEADRALRKVAVTVDEGAYQSQKSITFSDWADKWIAGLDLKPSTKDSYSTTMRLAKAELGREDCPPNWDGRH